jgi:Protein of unknown function (DUF1176)
MRWIGLSAFAVLSLCGAAAGSAPMAKPAGAAPIYSEFGAWVLACDNVRTCTARYANPGDDGNDGYLSFSQDAGPSGAVRVMISQAEGGKLDLDGRPLGRFAWRIVGRTDRGRQAMLEGAAALKFIRTIRDGRELSYNAGGSVVALDGFKAALSALNEAQGHGDVPVLPLVYAHPAHAQHFNSKALSGAVRRAREKALPNDCDLDLARDDQAFVLNGREALVALACDIAPYNQTYIVFLTPMNAPDKAKPLRLPLEPGADPKDAARPEGRYLGVSWDARTATFHTRAKDRGRGDCGERSAWTFDGAAFQLTRYDKLGLCGGGPDGDWPTLYRAKVVVK